jgi:hypothetical protein
MNTFDKHVELAVEPGMVNELALVGAGLVHGDVEDEGLAVGLEAESLLVLLGNELAILVPCGLGLGTESEDAISTEAHLCKAVFARVMVTTGVQL